jgi:hypothetical protein
MKSFKQTIYRVLLLAVFSSLLYACGPKLIHSDIGKTVAFQITSNPPGASIEVVITTENEDGIERRFAAVTPYTEGPGTKGLVKYKVIDDKQTRQVWNITVTKKGFKTIKKEIYSPSIPETLHFDLVPDLAE